MKTIIPIYKSLNTALFFEQLNQAYEISNSRDWFTVLNNQVSLIVPDDVDPAKAYDVIANHNASDLSSSERMKNQILDLAKSAEGIALKDLSQAQIKALIAVLLFEAGGVDLATMTVRSLNDWA